MEFRILQRGRKVQDIQIILMETEEAKAIGGDEARRQLERDTLTYKTDKKR